MTTIKVPLPKNIESLNLSLFAPYTEYEIQPLHIKNMKNVFVTYSGLVMDSSGLVKESYHDYPEQDKACWNEIANYFHIANANSDNLIELNNNVYLLIHHPWYNYYHWMCEAILRLWIVRDRIDNMILILPDYYKDSDFIMGSLKPFKIQKIFFIPNGKSLFIKNLCLPQIKPICDSYFVKELIGIRKLYLNYIMQKGIDIDIGEKIYLSRKKASRKKVTNETEVEQLVQKYGFKVAYNEDYSFLEQVSLYSNAKFLISIHGSGLTNMLFMKDRSSILEVHKKKTNTLNRPSFVFWYQASALEFNYFHQICESGDDDDYFFGDFKIDVHNLEKAILEMLRTESSK
ncbi:MAG TPA: glycosyltransferase family 61 protein [Candidatus Dojkabacteria bacterium]|nr:glycosyltransferase family 61 protein [Candidatus Dojkabacteria bacterium]